VKIVKIMENFLNTTRVMNKRMLIKEMLTKGML
jgi:hypothetical protein